MKTSQLRLQLNPLSLALQAGFMALLVVPRIGHAQNEDVLALTQPVSTIEMGVVAVDPSSAKFGQYNGLNKAGASAITNINIRGGDAYTAEGGTYRWQFRANDLGTTSREINANAASQGVWSFGLGYDALQHNLSDTYQTPFIGTNGGDVFTLPAGFGLVANTNTLSAAQKAALHNVDISTTRENTSLNVGYNLSSRWDVKVDFNHLAQNGAKPMGFGSAGLGGVTGEVVSILPNPTNYQTDTLNLAANWTGDQANLTLAYFGSYFKEGNDRVIFQTYVGASALQTMSTMPSNDFHQFSISGGYKFTPRTRLTGSLSYARNTQNDAFVVDSNLYYAGNTAPGNARTSLGGVVVNTHADLKLADQTSRDLLLSASIKYDDRDNRTASDMFNFYALSGTAGPNNVAFYPNTPLSNRKTMLEFAGDYRIDQAQHVNLTYTREDVRRWCNNYAVGTANQVAAMTSYAVGVVNYPAGTNCVVATDSADNKLGATYRVRASDDLNMNLGYSYSDRNTNSDPNAIAAFIGPNGNINPTAASALLVRGQNGGDFRGFYPFFDASRQEQVLKVSAAWQASEQLSLSASSKYTDDKYGSTYGVQGGNGWSLNLDSTYSYTEAGSLSAYFTQQHRQRDMTNKQNALAVTAIANRINVPANSNWTNSLKDDDTTIGLNLKQGGLGGGKLELVGDLSYTTSATRYSTALNYTGKSSDVPPVFCYSPSILSCGILPDIASEIITLKITGNYQVDKKSHWALGYMYQQLRSSDYYYNALQYGSTSNTMMPTNQTASNYTANVVSVSYVYSF
jgi:MtrB/PioB family decaheme-associated outer membrane protein